MNFELGEHIVRNAEPKSKKESELLKKTSKRTNSSLRVVKMDGYAEDRVGQDPARSRQTLV